MTRKTITLMLEGNGTSPAAVSATETALLGVPGVIHAIVNPSTEAAYIVYDADRCTAGELARAIPARRAPGSED